LNIVDKEKLKHNEEYIKTWDNFGLSVLYIELLNDYYASKDLLNENQLDFIDKMLKTYQQESNIVINKIECKDNTSDLSELLNDLTISLSEL
jgi:hypothetical protein